MALQVWLPMDKTLNNQGLSDTMVTNNGAALNSNGKIGGCYTFDGSTSYITFTNPITSNDTEFSICCWVKFNTVSGNATICTMRTTVGGGIAFFRIGSNFRLDDNAQATFASYTISSGEWLHVAVTRNAVAKKLYINGELKQTTSTVGDMDRIYSIGSIGASSASGSGFGNFTNGSMSDLRIYDHCLSAKEVSEIAKGLVLHYPLNNGGFGDTVIEEPIYSAMGLNDAIEYDCSGFGNDGTQSGTLVYSADSARYSGCCNFTGSNRITTSNIAFENIDSGTISFWIKFNNEFKNWTHYIFFSNGFNWTATGKDFIIVANSGNLSTSVTSTNIALDCCSYNNSFTASLNTWYHIVITWDKNNYTIKKYVNGELKATNDDSTNKRLDTYRASHSYHCIGNESSSASYAGDFDVSDFRIYATALSADAIKQLYSSPISVDKSGNLYACEFKEV